MVYKPKINKTSCRHGESTQCIEIQKSLFAILWNLFSISTKVLHILLNIHLTKEVAKLYVYI